MSLLESLTNQRQKRLLDLRKESPTNSNDRTVDNNMSSQDHEPEEPLTKKSKIEEPTEIIKADITVDIEESDEEKESDVLVTDNEKKDVNVANDLKLKVKDDLDKLRKRTEKSLNNILRQRIVKQANEPEPH